VSDISTDLAASHGGLTIADKARLGSSIRDRAGANRLVLIGAVILSLVALAALIGPYIVPYDPYKIDFLHAALGPSLSHPFGTDQLGEDVFSRVIVATRLDLLTVLVAVALSSSIGVAIGAAAGFKGGPLDGTLMRSQDVLQAFPPFVFAMAIAFSLGPGVKSIIIATATVNIPGYARLTRNLMLSMKHSDFALAARGIGNGPFRLISRHLLPNMTGPIVVLMALQSGWVLLDASGLSFLGLGVSVPTAEWGLMISQGLQQFLAGSWWTYVFPGLAIGVTVLGFMLLGDGLQETLDPKRRRS
jgi:peptide/nickel transport system permease protein